jgi:hypothetical protein
VSLTTLEVSYSAPIIGGRKQLLIALGHPDELFGKPNFPRFPTGSRWYPAASTPIRIPPSGNCACIRAWSRRHLRPSFMHTSPSAESETCSSKTPRYRTQPFVERRVNGISLLGIPGPEFAEESDTSSSSVVRLDLVHFFPEDQFCDLDSQL